MLHQTQASAGPAVMPNPTSEEKMRDDAALNAFGTGKGNVEGAAMADVSGASSASVVGTVTGARKGPVPPIAEEPAKLFARKTMACSQCGKQLNIMEDSIFRLAENVDVRKGRDKIACSRTCNKLMIKKFFENDDSDDLAPENQSKAVEPASSSGPSLISVDQEMEGFR